MYAEGLGTGRDLAAALTYFENGANAGDEFSRRRIDITNLEIACQDKAGSPYEPGGVGHGVEFSALDPDAAIAACQAAIEANPDSVGDKVWLARALLKAKRLDEAIPMLKAGADKANVLAQVTYADLLLNGVGIDADPAEAIRLYQAAAEQYYAPAQYALGTVYQEGAGVDADAAQAAYWYKRALDNGLDIAQAKLDELEGTTEAKASTDMTGFGREGPAY
jgi:TPR repeat protein